MTVTCILQIGLIAFACAMIMYEFYISVKIFLKLKNASDGSLMSEAFKAVIDELKQDPDIDQEILSKFAKNIENEHVKSTKIFGFIHVLLTLMWICCGLTFVWLPMVIGTGLFSCGVIWLGMYDSRCFRKSIELSNKMFDDLLEKRKQTINSRINIQNNEETNKETETSNN